MAQNQDQQRRYRWRYGGDGAWQHVYVDDDAQYGEARAFVKRRSKRVTSHEVERIFLSDEAQQQLDQAEAEKASIKVAGPRLSELIPLFLNASHDVEINTVNRYRPRLQFLVDRTADKRARQVVKLDIDMALAVLQRCDCSEGVPGPICRRSRKDTTVAHTTGLGVEGAKRYKDAWGKFFKFCVANKYLEEDPTKDVKLKRSSGATKEERHFYLEIPEFNFLLSCMDPQYRLFLDFLVNTGARFSEATALTKSALHLDGSEPAVVIRAAYKAGDGAKKYLGDPKSGSLRRIGISPGLTKRLKIATEDLADNALIFTATEGGVLDNSNFRKRWWNPMVIRAMRCPDHPPAPGGRKIGLNALKGPRCRDNGGCNPKGKPCGSFVVPGYDRCKDHVGVQPDAVSDCDCKTRIKRWLTPHDLRHTHASNQIRDKHPLAAIAQRLGHSPAVLIKVYAGILPDVAAALASLDMTKLDY